MMMPPYWCWRKSPLSRSATDQQTPASSPDLHARQEWQQNGRQINVGVDVWPVSFLQLVELIDAGPTRLGIPLSLPRVR